MIFSYNWLQSFFNRKLPKPRKLAEILTRHVFEVEAVEKIKNDWTLDIAVNPNRGDCFSHLAIAREIAAILDYKIKGIKPELKEEKESKTNDFIKVEIKNKDACPRYTARVMTDVWVGSSPNYIKERLAACGLQPINNIVDIANYVMLETGQPLHIFDLDKLEGKKIIVRFAKDNEKIITLDNQKFDLDKNILVIADEKNPVAIAGIKGGKNPEIDTKTRTIVIESANFDYQIIRQASKSLDLKTDASWRFEHGLDPNLTEYAINQAAQLIQELAKGKIAQGLNDSYPQKVVAKKIRLDLDYLKSLLGTEIPKEKIIKILESLGFSVQQKKLKILDVKVPTIRQDLSISEDLIEEIARIYGYEKIKPILPLAILLPPKKNEDIFWQNFVRDILKEFSFTEVYNYSFISQKDADIFSLKKELVEIENPVSDEQRYLRPSLIINLLKNIRSNLKYYCEIKIFEIGKTFQNFKEITMLAGVIARKEEEKELFYELKGIIDLLLNKLCISDIWYDQYQPIPEESNLNFWHPKKCAEIKVGQQEIGFLGEISPKILQALKIKEKVCLFDINFELLEKLCSEEQEYRPLSLFPAAVRDLAILVPREVKVVDVMNKINAVGGALVRDVDLFDMYEGKQLPEGKKNLAFHLVYQAEDHTLTAKEIEQIHNKIIKTLEKDPSWEVRK